MAGSLDFQSIILNILKLPNLQDENHILITFLYPMSSPKPGPQYVLRKFLSSCEILSLILFCLPNKLF